MKNTTRLKKFCLPIIITFIFILLIFLSFRSGVKKIKTPKIYRPSTEGEMFFVCKFACMELSGVYSNVTISKLKFTDWCTFGIRFYDGECPTVEKCYKQRTSAKCNDSLDQFSEKFPERVALNCTFRLKTGELCNPDAIEDGWIKCCKESSLENCNCR